MGSLTTRFNCRSVPAPLGITTAGRCLGVDQDNYSVIIATYCTVLFSYDGRSLRESTTTRVLCLNDLTSGTVAILSTMCAYVRLQNLPWYKTGLVSRQVLHLLSKLQNWIWPKTGQYKTCLVSNTKIEASIRDTKPKPWQSHLTSETIKIFIQNKKACFGTKPRWVNIAFHMWNNIIYISSLLWFIILDSAPGPLHLDNLDMCLTYNTKLQLVLAATCDETMFYYDGEYIREAATHLCIPSNETTDYSEVQRLCKEYIYIYICAFKMCC